MVVEVDMESGLDVEDATTSTPLGVDVALEGII